MRQRNPDRVRVWRDLVDTWKRSGQTINAFCRDRKPNRSNFDRWRRILSDRPAKSKPSSFVPLRIMAEPMAEVVLLSGVVVRLPLTTTADVVTRLIAGVGAATC